MDDAGLSGTIVVDARFRGPPRSGNGGYCSGLLSSYVDGPVGEGAVRVMLKAPPPLGQDLEIRRDGACAHLIDGVQEIAVAEPASLSTSVREAVGFDEADAASRQYVGFHDHLCPGCFVCGPERETGDGLRIFAGPVNGQDLVAAPWSPQPDLCDAHGFVSAEFLWSALDCPTYFASPIVGQLALLGSMTAEIFKRPRAGDGLVVCAWPIGADGRKQFSASAIYTGDGTLLAMAECLWITLKEDQFGIYDKERPGT